MTFLAFGLILGGALGAAFLAAVRSWPAPRREVRVTISPNSITARRALTLANPSLSREHRPFPGSPDDAAWPERAPTSSPSGQAGAAPTAVPAPSMRTRVPEAPGLGLAIVAAVAVDGGHWATARGLPDDPFHGPGPAPASATATPAGSSVAVAVKPACVAVPVTRAMTAMLDVGASPERLVRPRLPVEPARPTLAGTAVGLTVTGSGAAEAAGAVGAAEAVGPGEPDATPVPAQAGALPSASADATADPCSNQRAAAHERCAAATTARERSLAAAAAARDAKRTFDALQEQVDRAQALSDPKAVVAAKAALRDQFRKEDAAAATPDDSEAAARRWLHGISQANRDVRSARLLVETGTAELRERLVTVERLAREADAARILADRADEACRIAREELARCEEHVAATTPVPAPEDQHPFAGIWPTQQDLTPFRSPQDTPADALAGQSAILRLVRGDRAARDRVVATVAGSDPAAAATWQIRITALSDAIVARAIEAGYLVLPDDDAFWGLFSDPERREIVEALAALGFRFDGLGGFADDRVPATRDLSLAVGYAGLDRMRIRTWPREAEITSLYSRAAVAADEWLVWAARDLELGSLMSALGSRAAGLSAIWDAWGRIRPALLATD